MATLSPLLLAALLWVPVRTLTCYGDSGQPVDWFVVYKLPAQSGPGDAAQRGLRYKYMDKDSGGWRDGAGSINSSAGAVGRSLLPLYQNASQLAFLLYNDQPPKSSGSQDFVAIRGHTKGVLLLDQEGGFWLVHSVPQFPAPASSGAYSWPSNAHTYGQTLLCVSFPLAQFWKIGRQLTYTYPLVYDHKLDADFAQKVPYLKDVVKGHHVLHSPWNSSVTLTSKAGDTFQSFAKYGKFGDDLYSGWLAEALGSNLQVQFWQNSHGILPSNCSRVQHVLDVTQIAFPGPAGPAFSAREDHSKWCVAPEGPWACVGDMNRNLGEEHRGGGTLCAQLPALWKAFQPLVKAWKPCGETELLSRKSSRAYKS
ncbi:LOW QUALITY PROTEIN: deoxyribonuclease-2-alpha [Canis lupus baileyi]|uniref:LOW QUALITY PROTEIN: deoxyribonuclease-2-alpha n=1 Tax=Canis lupus dingo TaxID=286419 RepID=UPI0006B3C65C|nr:LOW QUALITY PROTEIN: deoxyribonuclease-2-alpha [Canis lupus dingo]XP_038284390.1 LOW QUALITY PROTEIN: deoxyribonuclease-2-alpha [Canis lupus familiaris]XP_038423063.1 LOW QUALITY PROTEIN: deoxyribonuclease-2-alpha [Canis lupus familiaris]XP_533902.3 LOW QUALITY PROTEIN: deoxyribonuclease-2-alpha [Canis lupus familiaris]|eukprot:XP_533902.3 LOW QUALITY PROTEIN: deoxyribonuclease-2-alpha [Canis lupus familiaris]